jgi:maleate isomerase
VSSFVEHAPAAAEMVARLSPRIILYAFTSSSYALGVGRDEELTATLEKRVGGIPVIPTCDAAVEALRFLRVRRIALVHPPWFAEDISRKGMEYFRAHGMDVVYCDRITPARAFTEVPPAEVYEWVAAKAPHEAEVIFIGGNGLRAVGVIHALEDRLHKPVLTANQVLVWDALRMLKVNSKPNGYGRLFSNNGAGR